MVRPLQPQRLTILLTERNADMPNGSITTTCKIEGLDALKESLENLSPQLAKRLANKAMKAGANHIKEAMKAAAPVLADKSNPHAIPGDLRDSIAVKTYTTRGKANRLLNALDRVVMIIGPQHLARSNKTMDPGFYARFVEYGLRVKNYVAKPFARPVFDGEAEKAIAIVAESLRNDLPDAVRRSAAARKGR
jgi:HK97 gp10 family phage protein